MVEPISGTSVGTRANESIIEKLKKCRGPSTQPKKDRIKGPIRSPSSGWKSLDFVLQSCLPQADNLKRHQKYGGVPPADLFFFLRFPPKKIERLKWHWKSVFFAFSVKGFLESLIRNTK